MKVSIIIPIFNAQHFLQRAIESCLIQKEIDEIILVEDGSTDSSLSICQQYERANSRVILAQHNEGINQGPAASRNLGIRMAKNQFISFLDADDYLLPNRFRLTRKIFRASSEVMAVYECLGTEFYDLEGKIAFARRHGISNGALDGFETKVSANVTSDRLIHHLLTHQNESFSIVALTVNREVFKKIQGFPIELRTSQDTCFIYQLASIYALRKGSERPVAIRGVHRNNRHTSQTKDQISITNQRLYYELLKWGYLQKIRADVNSMFFMKYVYYSNLRRNNNDSSKITKLSTLSEFIRISLAHPAIVINLIKQNLLSTFEAY